MNLTQHWRATFENNYLGAWNLYNAKTGKFATVEVTIDSIKHDTIVKPGGKKEMGWLAYLRGKDGTVRRTPMILSKTMGRTLQGMFGRTMADWIGKTITLWVETDVRVQGGIGDVLRIKNTAAGRGLARKLAPPPEDDEPPAAVPEPETFGEEEKSNV